MAAALAKDTRHGQHADAEDDQEVAHYSSTTSMCGLPASSSNLRVSTSEYFGSSHSTTMKNRSWVTSEKRLFFSNGWCRRGRRFKNNMPNKEPNAPKRIVS